MVKLVVNLEWDILTTYMWLMDMTLLFLDWVIKLVLVSSEIKNISRALA